MISWVFTTYEALIFTYIAPFLFLNKLQGRYYYIFPEDEKTEAQSGTVICLRSHSRVGIQIYVWLSSEFRAFICYHVVFPLKN